MGDGGTWHGSMSRLMYRVILYGEPELLPADPGPCCLLRAGSPIERGLSVVTPLDIGSRGPSAYRIPYRFGLCVAAVVCSVDNGYRQWGDARARAHAREMSDERDETYCNANNVYG